MPIRAEDMLCVCFTFWHMWTSRVSSTGLWICIPASSVGFPVWGESANLWEEGRGSRTAVFNQEEVANTRQCRPPPWWSHCMHMDFSYKSPFISYLSLYYVIVSLNGIWLWTCQKLNTWASTQLSIPGNSSCLLGAVWAQSMTDWLAMQSAQNDPSLTVQKRHQDLVGQLSSIILYHILLWNLESVQSSWILQTMQFALWVFFSQVCWVSPWVLVVDLQPILTWVDSLPWWLNILNPGWVLRAQLHRWKALLVWSEWWFWSLSVGIPRCFFL